MPSNHKGLFLSHAKCLSQVGRWDVLVAGSQAWDAATLPNIPSGLSIEMRAWEGPTLTNKFSSPQMTCVSLLLLSHWGGLVTSPHSTTGS